MYSLSHNLKNIRHKCGRPQNIKSSKLMLWPTQKSAPSTMCKGLSGFFDRRSREISFAPERRRRSHMCPFDSDSSASVESVETRERQVRIERNDTCAAGHRRTEIMGPFGADNSKPNQPNSWRRRIMIILDKPITVINSYIHRDKPPSHKQTMAEFRDRLGDTEARMKQAEDRLRRRRGG